MKAHFDHAQLRARTRFQANTREPVTWFTGVWPGRLEVDAQDLRTDLLPPLDLRKKETVRQAFFSEALPKAMNKHVQGATWGLLHADDVELEIRYRPLLGDVIPFSLRFKLRLVSRDHWAWGKRIQTNGAYADIKEITARVAARWLQVGSPEA